MFTLIDHVMICVPDLARGTEQYRRLGFNVHPGGIHTGKGTHNAIALNEEDYIELLAIRDPAELRAAATPGTWHEGLERFIAAGGGMRYVILQSDDLAADVAAMRRRGVDVTDAIEGSRRTPAGQELWWKTAVLGPKNLLPIFFIQHLTPLAERRRITTGSDAPVTRHPSPITDVGHPNSVRFLERAYIVTRDIEAETAIYAKVLGIPEPRRYEGMVIMSHMAVFQFGPAGLTVAQPYAPGPAAEALERRGPGPFQALFRTTSMGAAARWMQEHGLPPPARGVRDTGEQAMLVPPGDSCGAYIGFVGPE